MLDECRINVKHCKLHILIKRNNWANMPIKRFSFLVAKLLIRREVGTKLIETLNNNIEVHWFLLITMVYSGASPNRSINTPISRHNHNGHIVEVLPLRCGQQRQICCWESPAKIHRGIKNYNGNNNGYNAREIWQMDWRGKSPMMRPAHNVNATTYFHTSLNASMFEIYAYIRALLKNRIITSLLGNELTLVLLQFNT